MKFPFKNSPPSLSLCMIVKDEESYIRGCLQSVVDVVQEIIVIDTGCSDDTVQIVQEFGAKVHTFRWNDDFAAARNESLRHATGDWILQIDADERLLPECKSELKRLLRTREAICISVIIDSPKREQNKGHLSRSHRLFRNLSGIRYHGRIHEQISPSVRKLNGCERFSTITLRHLGYAKNELEMRKKSLRNYALLKKQIAEEPQNAYWHYSMAQNQILNSKYEEALESLNTALRLGGLPQDIRCSIFNNLAEVHLKLERYQEAIEFAEKSLGVTSRQTLAHLLLCEIYGKLGDSGQQIRCLEAAADLLEKKTQTVSEPSLEAYVDETAIHLALGRHFLLARRFEEARARFERVLKRDKENLQALKGLGDALIGLGQFENALPVLETIRNMEPGDLQTLGKLALILLKVQDFSYAINIYHELLRLDSGNADVKKRLAALYHKVGQTDKGRALMQELRLEQHAPSSTQNSPV